MPLRNHTRGLFANWCVASWTSLWPLLLVLLLCFVVPFSILLSLDILHSPCFETRVEFVSVCVFMLLTVRRAVPPMDVAFMDNATFPD